METVVGALVGGVLAIAAGTFAARSSRANETIRRREDRHLDLSRDALATLQRLVRATINVAYIDLPTRSASQTDTAEQAAARAAFEQAVTDWNAAMYGVLVGADSAAADSVRRIDTEVDHLTGLALEKQWDRLAFREERRQLGRLMAEHIDIARAEANLAKLGLTTVWTWDSGPSSCL